MIPVLSSNKFCSSENAESSLPEPSESNALLTKILPHHPREARSPTPSLHKDSCTLLTRFQKTSPFYEAFALMFFSSFSFSFIPVQMISWTSGWLRRSQFILWPAWGALSLINPVLCVHVCVAINSWLQDSRTSPDFERPLLSCKRTTCCQWWTWKTGIPSMLAHQRSSLLLR